MYSIVINHESSNIGFPYLQTGEKPFASIGSIEQLDRSHGYPIKPYILTNEVNLKETGRILTIYPNPKRPFHIGFSCWHNFDLIVARQSCGAIVADISDCVFEFYSETKKCVIRAENRESFVNDMLNSFKDDRYQRKYCREKLSFYIDQLEKELFREESWLSTDEGFNFIKDLYQNNRIVHLRLDIVDTESFFKIKVFLDENSLSLDTLYVTNIADWLIKIGNDERGNVLEKMVQSIMSVASAETLIVHATDRFTKQIEQHVCLASEFNPSLTAPIAHKIQQLPIGKMEDHKKL